MHRFVLDIYLTNAPNMTATYFFAQGILARIKPLPVYLDKTLRVINELFWAIQYFASLLFKLNMVCDTAIPWNNNRRYTTHSPTLLHS